MKTTLAAIRVGSVELKNTVLTASGTSGHGAELNDYMPLAELGGVVVKSLAASSVISTEHLINSPS